MKSIPTGGRPDPAESYVPFEIREATGVDGKKCLELLVNIEDRPRSILLTLDALQDHGLSGPAAVEALLGIQAAVESLVSEVRSLDR